MKRIKLYLLILLFCFTANCEEVLEKVWSLRIDEITGNKGIYPSEVIAFTGEDGSAAIQFYGLSDYIVWISSSGKVLLVASKAETFGVQFSGNIDILGCSNQLLTVLESNDNLNSIRDRKIVQYQILNGVLTARSEIIKSSKTRRVFGIPEPLNKNIIVTLQSPSKNPPLDTVVCYQLINRHKDGAVISGDELVNKYISFRSTPLDQYVVLGGSVELKADVESTIPTTYQWQKDGKDLAGATSVILKVDKISAINGGVYALIVKSALGSLTSSPAKLDIVSLPIVNFATNNVSGEFGKITTLVPTIISKGPTLYRWFKNGVAISGEEKNSIDISAYSQSGHYSIECRNLAGLVMSKTVLFVPATMPFAVKKWEHLTGAPVFSSPAIGSDGTVYVGSRDYKVYALNGTTGAKKWEFLTGSAVDSSPAIGSDGTVYVGSFDNRVYALNGATGAKKWEFLTGDWVESSPAIGSDGTVYVGSHDKRVYALNGTTGAKQWEFLTGDRISSSPAVGSDGTVYIGSGDNKVYALNGATGAKKWEFLTGAWVGSSPAIGADGTVYIGSGDNKVYALNGTTGAKKWEFLTDKNSLPIYSSPAIGSDGTVYIGSGDFKVYALNGTTGAKKWEFLTENWVTSSPAIGADGTVYVGSLYNRLYALVGATGAKKWEFLIEAAGIDPYFSSPAIGSDGTVYFGSRDNKLYAISSDSSQGLAKSPWPKFHANNQNTGRTASGSAPLVINYSLQNGLNIDIPISSDLDTILEYSTNLNEWIEQQRFGRQIDVPSINVPLKIDQRKEMEYWRTRSQ